MVGPAVSIVTVLTLGLIASKSVSHARMANEPIAVTIQAVREGGVYAGLDFQLTFDGDADGVTDFILPDSWGGQNELWRSTTGLVAEGARLELANDSTRGQMLHLPGARVTLRYRIVQTHVGEPQAGPSNEYRPIIQPAYFQVFGATAVPNIVHLEADTQVQVSLVPSGSDSIASDLEHNHGRARWRDLFASTVVGGDFRVLGSLDGLRVAIRGAWPRTDPQWHEAVDRIGAAQTQYWRDNSRPFLATILPVAGGADVVSLGGTGLGDAFGFFATTNAPLSKIDEVLSHETSHTWVPGLLGQISTEQAQSQELAWLGEGFTDWVSWRSLNQAGLLDGDRVLSLINQGLQEYDLSPLRNARNAETAPLFHRDPEAGRHPYRKGMLLAMRWNAMIHQATNGQKSFDDVLVAMRQHAAGHPQTPVLTNLLDQTKVIAGIDLQADLDAIVTEGATVEFDPASLAPCLVLLTVTRPVFERGFDPVATRLGGGIVTGVDPQSAAYAAGLRNGMRLIRRVAGVTGDPNQTLSFEVATEGSTTILSWMPRGSRTETFRRLARTTPAPTQNCSNLIGR